jgi:hypothetical protein
MPTGTYYRRQAQVFARLSVATSDPHIAERYNQMALEQLAKAEEVDPSTGVVEPGTILGDDGGDMDRD